MEFGHIIVFILIIGVVIAGAYFAHLAAKKRREEMAALAAELGWQFDPSHDGSHDEQYSHFEIFRRGHSRNAYNTLTGLLTIDDRQCPAKMGDFTYKVTSGSGKNRRTTTYRFSYLIVHLPFNGVADLLIRPEGMFDKIAGAFGFDDIDFESAEFSRRFHVKSPDKRFAYDICHPRMMEFLMQTNPPAVDIEHGRCCMSDGSKRWEPAQFRAMLRWIEKFFHHWPGHVTQELDRRIAS
jgi:hypothetical protein